MPPVPFLSFNGGTLRGGWLIMAKQNLERSRDLNCWQEVVLLLTGTA
jgi:hypothetical protein